MLKIKADKMNELEKFGFKKRKTLGGEYVYHKDMYNNYGLYIVIEIMPSRIITFVVNCDDVCVDAELDILYELFANDMVEKVEE